MKIAVGSDHGGFQLKSKIIAYLKENHMQVNDVGTHDEVSCDYPDYAKAVAEEVTGGDCQYGILVCGTGLGITIAANKVQGVIAAPVSDCYSAEMARKHNNANILGLGQRVVGEGLALKIVDTFLNTAFEGGRHQKRVDKIKKIEGSL